MRFFPNFFFKDYDPSLKHIILLKKKKLKVEQFLNLGLGLAFLSREKLWQIR